MSNIRRKAAVLAASIIALPALIAGTPARAASGDNSSEGSAIVLALAGGLVLALSGHSGGHGQGNDGPGTAEPLFRPAASAPSIGGPLAVYTEAPVSTGSVPRTSLLQDPANPPVPAATVASLPVSDVFTGTDDAAPVEALYAPVLATPALTGLHPALTTRAAPLVAAVPEPSPAAVLAVGAFGLLGLAARRRAASIAR